MPVLIDTSFLVAVSPPQDTNHATARAALRKITDKRVVAAAVLPELFYMLATWVSYKTAISVFDTIRTGAFQVEALTALDVGRMRQIMAEYEDNAFDFVDTAIMALSERLNVTAIYTFDRRDFSVFRPVQHPYLRLLP